MSLADQALANLVDQFARPLDFLRELAQNAIDAGSPRIEVSVEHEPGEDGKGVTTIVVRDFGDGMDEAIIDQQLTRLFASTKEDDLTKIGKFGIGFTSVFAIRPEAVLVRTGRHGESWELLFHADRTFDKVRLDKPVVGTTITVFKRMPQERFRSFVEECRSNLTFWCEHSDTPIAFGEADAGPVSTPDPDDPFAAFAEPEAAESRTINRPLDLDVALRVRHSEAGIEAVLGAGGPPRFGFYSGGLTLLSTTNTDALGRHAETLGHLTFKLKSDRLEHTLTRDNVIQDEAWERAMEVVLAARTALRAALVDRLEAAVDKNAPDVDTWQRLVARELGTPDGRAWFERKHLERNLFVDVRGRPLTPQAILDTRTPDVLLAKTRDALVEAVDGLSIPVVRDQPGAREFLEHLTEKSRRSLRDVGDVFVLPQLVPHPELSSLEQQLITRVQDLLRAAVGLQVVFRSRRWSWEPETDSWANRLDVRVGDFGGLERGAREVLALDGPKSGSVFLRPKRRRQWLPAFLSWRTLLVNRRHPLFRSWVLASADEPHAAAYGLSVALLHTEDIEGEGAYRRLLQRAQEGLA